MKLAMVVALVGAALVVVISGGPFSSGEVHAQRFAESRAVVQDARQAGDLVTLSASGADDQGKPVQQVTIIDSTSRVMGVYHVKTETGTIELKSVRKFDWDLQMDEFNATVPLPREVHSQVTPNYRK